jgi:tellurite resistance protein TerC
MWVGFIAFVMAMLALDLGVFQRRSHVVGAREALAWTVVWVSLALLFGVGLGFYFGREVSLLFITGFIIEKSLSVDNLFVFILVFGVFRIPPQLQHRVLYWGILGAIVLRMVMILAGAALVQQFHAILYGFGALLIYSGAKILVLRDGDGGGKPEENRIIKLASRFMPSVPELDGQRFFVVREGRRLATPLLLCLVAVELSDVVFAVDSIPAIFVITNDPFIIFTSNIFAIMGLRSLYFLLARWVDLFRFLKTGVGIVLVFVGVKMLVVFFDIKVPTVVSLGVVVGVLVASILVSVLVPPKTPEARP